MSEPRMPPRILIDLLASRATEQQLGDSAAWTLLTENSGAYGVSAIAASIARPLVHGAARQWCDRVLKRSWRMHDESLSQLSAIAESLDREGIASIALKGPLLGQRAYIPPFARRPCHDLDIGIRGADVERAVAVLSRLGYYGASSISAARVRSHHLEMWHPSLYKVEVHFRLSHGFLGIPIEDILKRSERQSLLNGTSISVPSPADQLAHGILHGGQCLSSFFHTYEIRHLWGAAQPKDREAAIIRLRDFGFRGVTALADVASLFYWDEPLLNSEERGMLDTWLGFRIREDLLRKYLMHSDPFRKIGFGTRLHRRFLDLQLTDSPSRAITLLARLLPSAALLLWSTVREKRSSADPQG